MQEITFYIMVIVVLALREKTSRVYAINLDHLLLTINPLHRVICQFNTFAKNRGYRYAFTVGDLDPQYCTHIFYHQIFIEDVKNISPTTTCTFRDEYTDFTNLRYAKRHLRLFLTVGENTEGLDFVSMVENESLLANFVSSVTMMLRLCRFHGLNLDFKVTPHTSIAFTTLLTILSESFERDDKITTERKLELAASVHAPVNDINSRYQVSKISSLLDMITIFTFEEHSDEDKVLRVTNRLYSEESPRSSLNKKDNPGESNDSSFINDGENSMDAKIKKWIQLGANSSKLNLAISLVGRGYVLQSISHHDIGDPFVVLSESTHTHKTGHINFNELCVKIKEGGQLVRLSPVDDTPYWYNMKLWVNFEDPLSMVQKVNYLRKNGLKGVAVMSQADDDFTGTFCNDKFYISKWVYRASGAQQILDSIPEPIPLHCD